MDDESQIMKEEQSTGTKNGTFSYNCPVKSDERGQAASYSGKAPKIESMGLSLKRRPS